MTVAAILLMGPTGAGKSDAALALAQTLPVEIVSVDATLVYRGLDIGSAKPTPAERERSVHHLVDICDPTERYSVGEFLRDVVPLMAAIRARGKVPLLVGGTMLYFRALQSGLATLPPADPSIRAELAARAAVEGWPALHSQLARVDPEAAARIAPRDGQRIQRALEVERLTGTPLSRLQREDLKRRSDAAYLKLVLAPTRRETLDERLAGRFDRMLAAGLLEEIRALHARGDLSPDLPALRAVGYRQLWPVVSCGEDLGMARAAAIQATRQLAKRQYTWLRAEPDAKWLEPGADGGVAALRQVIGATLTAG